MLGHMDSCSDGHLLELQLRLLLLAWDHIMGLGVLLLGLISAPIVRHALRRRTRQVWYQPRPL